MMTKKEERAALEKIRDILSELDDDSYIMAAFAGCVEDAERNINEDAFYSLKNRCSSLEIRNRDAIETINRLNRENDDLQRELDAVKADRDRINHALNMEIADRKEIRINDYFGRFKKFEFLPGFVKIEQPDGWTDCYKFEDVKELVIE